MPRARKHLQQESRRLLPSGLPLFRSTLQEILGFRGGSVAPPESLDRVYAALSEALSTTMGEGATDCEPPLVAVDELGREVAASSVVHVNPRLAVVTAFEHAAVEAFADSKHREAARLATWAFADELRVGILRGETVEDPNSRESLFAALPVPALLLDARGALLRVNEAALRLLGVDRAAMSGRGWLRRIHPDDRERVEQLGNWARQDGVALRVDCRVRVAGDAYRSVTLFGAVFDASGGAQVQIVTVEDTSEVRWLRSRLSFLSTHDALTGVHSRRALEEEMTRVLEEASHGTPGAILFVDVDDLGRTNDRLGHEGGDTILRELAAVLQKSVKPTDFVARVCGDEFAILLTDADVGSAMSVAEELRALVGSHIFRYRGEKVSISVSIGVAPISASFAEPPRTDEKESIHRSVAFARAVVGAAGQEPNLQVKLSRAVGQGEVALSAQPVLRLEDRGAAYSDVSLRVRLAEGNDTGHDALLTAAERGGVSGRLTRWMLAESVRAMAENPTLRVALRLGGMDLLDSSLPDHVRALLGEHEVYSDRLGFEVTQSALATMTSAAPAWIMKYRDIGCWFVLGEADTSTAARPALLQLPVQQITLARSVLRLLAASTSRADVAAVAALKDLAERKGLTVAAAGVDTEQELEIVERLGFELAQGTALAPLSPLGHAHAVPLAAFLPESRDGGD